MAIILFIIIYFIGFLIGLFYWKKAKREPSYDNDVDDFIYGCNTLFISPSLVGLLLSAILVLKWWIILILFLLVIIALYIYGDETKKYFNDKIRALNTKKGIKDDIWK